uniref:Uncharacterized protein n=1 Tax=Schistocephalus solidus TaxID=70667 RepID=A0A0X3Q487_SCHSO
MSLIKQQILKPLSRFAKNLNANQIKLSALKGEVDMENIELDEDVFMELLELPAWLQIRSASCTHLSLKIPWTHLKSQPILVTLEFVTAQIEVLEIPRTIPQQSTPSYRNAGGRYGFVDKVIDGLSLKIHELKIDVLAKTFALSVQLSNIVMANKKPNWQPGPLNLSFIGCPDQNAVLFFKEVYWESTRLEANGLTEYANTTPVKMITNGASLRLTFKKSLLDSSVLCGKFSLILESLLWVLTVSQVEAVILFLKSIKECINLSAQKEQNMATEKMQKFLSGSFSGITSLSGMVPKDSPTTDSAAIPRRFTDPRLQELIDRYDIRENSFHLHVNLVETHFCEDPLQAKPISSQIAAFGSVRVTLNKLNFSHYPLHLRNSARDSWPGYRDINLMRSQWLSSLRADCNPESFCQRISFSSSSAAPLLRRACPSATIPALSPGREADSIFENVTVFRLQDITVGCVMLDQQQEQRTSASSVDMPFFSKLGKKAKTVLDPEQESLISNAFIASDLRMHKLPSSTDLISVDLTHYFTFDSPAEGLPLVLFAYVNPMHVKFHTDTLIWLNAFITSLTVNLQSLFGDKEPLSDEVAFPPLFIRAEMLMPRVIFPLIAPMHSKEGEPSGYPWVGPTALVVQFDIATLQSLPHPLPRAMSEELQLLLDRFEQSDRSDQDGEKRTFNAFGYPHVPPAWSRLRRFILGKRGTLTTAVSTATEERIKEILACLHIPSAWAEFLTVCEAARPEGLVDYRTYRQAFVEPIPLTVWAAARWPLRYRPPGAPRQRILWQEDLANKLRCPPSLPEPVSLLINFDSSANPLTVFTYRSTTGDSRAPPVRFILGHSGCACAFRSTRLIRLPDAVDHLAFLFALVHQFLRLRASVALDFADVLSRLSSDDDDDGGGGRIKVFHEWLFTAKCALGRGLRLEVEASPEPRQLLPFEEGQPLAGKLESEEETSSDEGLNQHPKPTDKRPSVLFEAVNFTAADKGSFEDRLVNDEYEELKKTQVMKAVATESVLLPEAHGLGSPMTGSAPDLDKLNAHGHFPISLSRSREMECITIGDMKAASVSGDQRRAPSTASLSSLDESLNGSDDFVPIGFNDLCDDDELLGSVLDGSGGSSFVEGLPLPDEIVTEKPDEIGAEAFTDDQDVSAGETFVGVFPPWHVDRLVVDFRSPTLDVGEFCNRLGIYTPVI